MLLRLKRDPDDRFAAARNATSFVASLLLHALIAYFLFSLATSSSQQAASESFSGSVVLTVTRQAPKKSASATVARAAVPVPRPVVVPKPRTPVAAHPRVLHELAKFAPTAPPNPTPAPQRTIAPERPVVPKPAPTRAQLAVTPAPLPPTAPTAAPAQVVAAARTAAPSPRPEPSALAPTQAPLIALHTPEPLITPGNPSELRTPHAAPSPSRGTAPSPGPKLAGSPGPRAVAHVKVPAPPVVRPVHPLAATPPPARPIPVKKSKRPASLNERLKTLIPTAAPSFSPAPGKHYSFLTNLKPTPEPEPTPPPAVLAQTKYLYVENVGAQRWKQSILGTAPEEAYVKMYVTRVKRIGFVNWCTGWVVRQPAAGHQHWIVEDNVSYICAGHLEPFTPPSPPANPG